MKALPFILAGASFLVLTGPASAFVVSDPITEAETTISAAKDAIMASQQVTQLAHEVTQINNQIKEYTQLITQYNQMVQNAKALTNLSSLLSAFGLSASDLSVQQFKTLLNQVSALSSTDANWDTDLATILKSQGYAPPMSATTAATKASAVYAPSGATAFEDNYNRTIASYQQYSKSQDLLNQAREKINLTQTATQDEMKQAGTLGDNSEVAVLQLITSQNANLQTQVDALLRQQAVLANAAQAQQLTTLQAEADRLQAKLTADQNMLDQVNAPVTLSSASPITQ